ncbi:MAG: MFS transporter, partial [Gemmatimonadota bacterium]
VVLKGTAPGERKLETKSALRPVTPRGFWPPVFALAAFTFFRLPETLLILRLQDLGVPLVTIPLVWAGLHVVRTSASYPGGWLVDHWGPRWVIVAGGLLFSAFALGLGFSISPLAGIALFLIFGLVAGLSESAERVLVSRLEPVRLGRGFGAYYALTGVAALPAGVLFGWLYQHVGAGPALWSSAGCIALTVLLWIGVSRPADLHRPGST